MRSTVTVTCPVPPSGGRETLMLTGLLSKDFRALVRNGSFLAPRIFRVCSPSPSEGRPSKGQPEAREGLVGARFSGSELSTPRSNLDGKDGPWVSSLAPISRSSSPKVRSMTVLLRGTTLIPIHGIVPLLGNGISFYRIKSISIDTDRDMIGFSGEAREQSTVELSSNPIAATNPITASTISV